MIEARHAGYDALIRKGQVRCLWRGGNYRAGSGCSITPFPALFSINFVYAKERRLIEKVESEVAERRKAPCAFMEFEGGEAR